MTAYELRHHLAETHHVQLRGSPMDVLEAVHDTEHQAAEQDHTHDD